MKNTKRYSKKFYEIMISNNNINNKSSAKEIVPLIIELLRPESIIDFGCAIGTWLNEFKKTGKVNKILGIDGDWVDEKDLLISKDEFYKFDLEKDITPYLHDKFDLVMCLEVAEHISKKSENILINNLVSLSDVIMFSAAIPNQGGDYHVNEQWQSYWINKFHHKGYICIDCIRPQIWDNKRIMYCYKQNVFIFVKNNKPNYINKLEKEKQRNDVCFKNIIHPEAYADCLNYNQSLKYLWQMQKKLLNIFVYKLKKYLLK